VLRACFIPLADRKCKLSFFSDLHNSIFSARFYKTVSEKSPGVTVRFVVLACFLTAAVSGAAHTYYSFDRKTGIAAQVSVMLNGMEFKNGSLDPHVATPYMPGTVHLEMLLNTLFCVPRFFTALPDSYFVVDTSEIALSRKSPTTQVLMGARNLYINPGTPVRFVVPYSLFLRGRDLVVTEESVQALLKKNLLVVASNFFIETGLVNTFVFLLSIIFLTFAAYIFRLERARKFGEFLKIACYAASPVYAGTNIVAFSGTTFAWTWHVLILVATFVMFRGVQASQNNPDQSSKQN
jgi:hypothetical protein